MRARVYPLPKPAPGVFDGQAYYDRHIPPFVDRFGERSGPVDLTPIPPRRVAEPEMAEAA
jgi:hypothetical protein